MMVDYRRKKISAPETSSNVLGKLHKQVSRRISLNGPPLGLNRNKSTPSLTTSDCKKCRPKSMNFDLHKIMPLSIYSDGSPTYKSTNPKKPLRRPKSCEIHQSMMVNSKTQAPPSPKTNKKFTNLFRKPSQKLSGLLSPTRSSPAIQEFNLQNTLPVIGRVQL